MRLHLLARMGGLSEDRQTSGRYFKADKLKTAVSGLFLFSCDRGVACQEIEQCRRGPRERAPPPLLAFRGTAASGKRNHFLHRGPYRGGRRSFRWAEPAVSSTGSKRSSGCSADGRVCRYASGDHHDSVFDPSVYRGREHPRIYRAGADEPGSHPMSSYWTLAKP